MAGELLRGESRIRFVCERHTERDPIGPLVTIVDGSWALCVGHLFDGHDWRQIELTQREYVPGPGQMQDREAG